MSSVKLHPVLICLFLNRITKKVIAGVYNGVTTVELDNLASETAAYLTTRHPDYAILAARIAISNLHKETKKNFSGVIHDLYRYVFGGFLFLDIYLKSNLRSPP
jgi:hypothetical protein